MSIISLSTQDDILNKLAHDSVDGHLLLFIGTGFSKAVLPPPAWSLETRVPSWPELLRELCKRMGLNPDKYILSRNSKYGESISGAPPTKWGDVPQIDYACPAIATRMCKEWEHLHDDTGKTGSSFLKELIAGLSVWVPMKETRNRVQKALEDINPIGIITTNYDMVLEAILAEKGKYLARDDVFRSRNDDKIPIWHVHGGIQNPESIVITNEDYQQFFRPDDYVQRKISMLLREYTTLFIGYSMSDPNIATAIDWAMHVFKPTLTPNDNIVQIRLVYGENEGVIQQDSMTPSMYYFETKDAIDFLEKLQINVLKEREKKQKEKEKFSKLAKLFIKLSEQHNFVSATGDGFFEDIVKKIQYLAHKRNNSDLILKLMPYVQSCITNARERARINNNFPAYADWLYILLVILKAFPFEEIPPALFALLAEELNAVLSKTGDELGKSYSANNLWLKESKKLSRKILTSFLEYAERLQLVSLSLKLKSVLNQGTTIP